MPNAQPRPPLRPRTRTRRRARVLGPLVLASAIVGLGAAPAQAQEYRYWSFWEGKDGSWSYATQGPSTSRPADGSTTGFRFTVSTGSAEAEKPRAAADFGAICDATPAKDGTKRVGLVLDFGTKDSAPDGETPPEPRTKCARVAEDATAADVLAEVARPLRYSSSGLTCAIAGYPTLGCADRVGGSSSGSSDASTERASGKPSGKAGGSRDSAAGDGGAGPSAGLIGGIAAVVVLGGAAVWQARRRRG